ncbi:hypothetical protein, partial [Caulobacter sp. B11]|uniref:hypothetical protein n=1 Tax=Caulobacter sp. B11 TaxID=2048899 RepID=UPI003518D897
SESRAGRRAAPASRLNRRRAVQDRTVNFGVRHLQNEGAVALVMGATLPLADTTPIAGPLTGPRRTSGGRGRISPPRGSPANARSPA